MCVYVIIAMHCSEFQNHIICTEPHMCSTNISMSMRNVIYMHIYILSRTKPAIHPIQSIATTIEHIHTRHNSSTRLSKLNGKRNHSQLPIISSSVVVVVCLAAAFATRRTSKAPRNYILYW